MLNTWKSKVKFAIKLSRKFYIIQREHVPDLDKNVRVKRYVKSREQFAHFPRQLNPEEVWIVAFGAPTDELGDETASMELKRKCEYSATSSPSGVLPRAHSDRLKVVIWTLFFA